MSFRGKNIYIRFAIVVLLFFSSCVSTRQDIDTEKGYQRLIKKNIGGVNQSLLIRGHNRQNPFLLVLHGGPGYPFFSEISEEFPYLQLEYYFNVVYWEQRGTGKSFSARIKKQTMNTQQFVSDIDEIVEFIKVSYNHEKIYLWGHSWGTNIGMIYASEHPESLYAYFSTGQSVNPLQNEQNAYATMMEEALIQKDEEMLEDLRAIDTTNYQLRDALKVRKWMYKYGGIEHKIRFKQPYAARSELKRFLRTPEYSLRDVFNIARKPYFSGDNLWKDLQEIDLVRDVPKVNIPVYFLLGRYDLIVSSTLAAEYFEKLEAPKGKTMWWFENSAHRPFKEEPIKFLDKVKIIVEETYPQFEQYKRTAGKSAFKKNEP
ncbi:MAG: alpha/beta fold hydrolase [Cyclobacteriaceae bacterium]